MSTQWHSGEPRNAFFPPLFFLEICLFLDNSGRRADETGYCRLVLFLSLSAMRPPVVKFATRGYSAAVERFFLGGEKRISEPSPARGRFQELDFLHVLMISPFSTLAPIS